jgi:class 3 adenylate cyclase
MTTVIMKALPDVEAINSSSKPANELERLAALRSFEILDTAPEIAYDEIAELAMQICDCPVAQISFIDDDRQWLKARYGLHTTEIATPRASAVCSTTICGTDAFVVPDLSEDPRFDHISIVRADPPCRFYCGVPLITDDGYALGALCVMDFQPRQLTFEQIGALQRLSHQVLSQLELRRKLIEYNKTIKLLDEARIEAAAERARSEQLLLENVERARSEQLLLENMLPKSVAEELKRSGKVQPKFTRSATVLFADFSGFTTLAKRVEPAALVALLDTYFTAFDDIMERYGLEKVKTVGDCYMAVAGVPVGGRRHPIDACLAALEMHSVVARINSQSERTKLPIMELRIGIHTGPVISGVVGNRRFSFDVWGDAVNTASFMEAHSLPGRTNVSETVAGHAKALFNLELRGSVKVKHARYFEMFFLERLKEEFSSDSDGRIPNEYFAAQYGHFGDIHVAAPPNERGPMARRQGGTIGISEITP